MAFSGNRLLESRSRLIAKIGVVVFCRLVLNTARRFTYPFAPVLSRELGVSLTAITSLIAVNWATSLLGFIFGPIADRSGYRKMMIIGLILLAVGMLAGGVFPFYGVMIIALFLAGLGKIIFDPAVQAYISERVPYHRRATAIGFIEISWAGSTLIGIPVIALLIDKVGWRSPFFAMGMMGILGALGMISLFPKTEKYGSQPAPALPLKKIMQILVGDKSSLGAIFYVFFFSAAVDNLFVVYGAWLEKAFDVGIVALGLGTSVIGAAELVGEIMVATISDRFGLKRVVMLGVMFCIFTYSLLPVVSQSFYLALAALFVHFLLFEFTIISSVALCTELRPDMRATTLAGFFAAAGLGRILGALMGGPVWLAGGIVLTGMISAGLTVFALAALFWGLRGWDKR
jgi:MFS transporter, DHA1 family, inner membrane transport protein